MPSIITLSVIHDDEMGSGPVANDTLIKFQTLQREFLENVDHISSVSVSHQFFDEDSCDE